MKKEFIYTTLANGDSVTVEIKVTTDAEIPTPLEPVVCRPPTLCEFMEILDNLQHLNFNIEHE